MKCDTNPRGVQGSSRHASSMSGRTSPAPRGRRPSRPASTTHAEARAAFEATVRDEIAPEGVLQNLLADVAARAAWSIDRTKTPAVRRRHERTMLRALDALATLRRPAPLPPCPPAEPLRDEERFARCAPYHVEGLGIDPDAVESTSEAVPTLAPEPLDGAWRSRLAFDPEVSESSPVVLGTWITASRVVSLVVDGWTWADILRAHPELTEDDLRACLAYTVEQEDDFRPATR